MSALSLKLTCSSPWVSISRDRVDVSEKFVLQPIVWNATRVVGVLTFLFSSYCGISGTVYFLASLSVMIGLQGLNLNFLPGSNRPHSRVGPRKCSDSHDPFLNTGAAN